MLTPAHDAALLGFGIGFTDVVKRPSANAADLARRDFAAGAPQLGVRLRRYRPRVACFHGLTAYRPFVRFALRRADLVPRLGPQTETIGSTRLYVVPNPSPANAHFTVADQAGWYDRLSDFIEAVRSGRG
jgi:double-stranded uracil-DNA glycosylase